MTNYRQFSMFRWNILNLIILLSQNDVIISSWNIFKNIGKKGPKLWICVTYVTHFQQASLKCPMDISFWKSLGVLSLLWRRKICNENWLQYKLTKLFKKSRFGVTYVTTSMGSRQIAITTKLFILELRFSLHLLRTYRSNDMTNNLKHYCFP